MNKLKSLVLIGLLPLSAACEDYGDLVADPNRPTAVNPSLLLTEVEVAAFDQVSTGAALASRYLVFTDGVSTEQYYDWQRGGFGLYNELRQVAKMMEEAERTGNSNYIALGKFFRAYHFAQLTQTFGDVPYSEALQGGEGNYAPAYDRQEDVYIGILRELEEANATLDPRNGEILGDVIYGGDVTQWKKLVNSFRLRVLMSLSAKQGNTRLNVAEQFRTIANDPARYPIFTSNADNAQLVFHDRDGNRYPLYNNRSVQTAFFLAESFVDLLKERQDPRLFSFAAPERSAVEQGNPGYQTAFTSYSGLDAGAPVGENVKRVADRGEGSPLNPRFYSNPVNEPSVLLSYPEVEFLLAEAAARGWIAADPAEHYHKGIRASMQFYGIPTDRIDAYLRQPSVAYDAGRAIEQISTQKYIAMFLNSGWEPFFNQRRTGFPQFRVGPATQNGGRVPNRWMYPQSELDRNRANVTAAIERQFGSDDVNAEMWLLRPE